MTDTIVHTLVGECMSREVISVDAYASLATAWELMTSHRVRRLPVVHGERLVGIITRSDVLNAQPADPGHRLGLAEIAAALDKLTVTVTMSRDPITVFDNDTLGHAAELMLEHKLGGLPVVDAAHALVGVITDSDIFRLLAARWRDDNARFSGAH